MIKFGIVDFSSTLILPTKENQYFLFTDGKFHRANTTFHSFKHLVHLQMTPVVIILETAGKALLAEELILLVCS